MGLVIVVDLPHDPVQDQHRQAGHDAPARGKPAFTGRRACRRCLLGRRAHWRQSRTRGGEQSRVCGRLFFAALAPWAKSAIAPGSCVLADGLLGSTCWNDRSMNTRSSSRFSRCAISIPSALRFGSHGAMARRCCHAGKSMFEKKDSEACRRTNVIRFKMSGSGGPGMTEPAFVKSKKTMSD